MIVPLADEPSVVQVVNEPGWANGFYFLDDEGKPHGPYRNDEEAYAQLKAYDKATSECG